MVNGDDRPELVDVFDVLAAPGPAADAPRPRPSRPAWWVLAVIAAVALLVVAVVAQGRAPADRGAEPSAARSVAAASPSVAARPVVPAAPRRASERSL